MDVRGKHIHFMGIGGIGMSAIALIARRRGARVSGCDLARNRNTERLEAEGVSCALGHEAAHLGSGPGAGVDILVYSSAVPPDAPERLAAGAAGIECISRSRMLARLMDDRKSLAIAGAHGKTTTTALVAHLLVEGGMDPTVMVGGHVPALGGNFREGGGEWFVTEVDESDGLLLEIRPTLSVLTNIDREHLDHYRDLDEIVETFARYLANTSAEGCIIGCGDDTRVARLLENCDRPAIRYGFAPGVDVRAENVTASATGSRFDAAAPSRRLAGLHVPLPGKHNVLNALAAVAVGEHFALDEAVVRQSLAGAPRVARRMEVKGSAGGVRVIDDYGHHPTEIAATVGALADTIGGRLIVVFQPHRYSRTKALAADFGPAFALADHVVVTSIYSANEPPIEGVTAALVADAVRKCGGPSIEYVPSRANLVPHLVSVVREGDTVLTLGAGDIGTLGDELLARL